MLGAKIPSYDWVQFVSDIRILVLRIECTKSHAKPHELCNPFAYQISRCSMSPRLFSFMEFSMSFHLDGIEKIMIKKLQNCDHQQVYKSARPFPLWNARILRVLIGNVSTAKQSSEVEVDVCEYSFYHPGLTYLMNIFIYFAIDNTDPDPLWLLTYWMKLFCFFSQQCSNSEDILSQDLFACLLVYSVCYAEANVCICAHVCTCL